MRVPTSIGFTLTASAALVMLAGRSGGSAAPTSLLQARGASTLVGQSIVPQVGGAALQRRAATLNQSKGWIKHVDAREPLTYISDDTGGGTSDIAVFDGHANFLGKITSGLLNAVGLFVDKRHNLWVANYSAHQVLKFARGGTTPINTLNDPNEYPNDVTICPNGTVYVSNVTSTSSAPGNIEVYAKGSINPTGTLSLAQPLYYLYLTCDAAGNVFSTAYNRASPGGVVVEFPDGAQSGAHLLPIASPSLTGIKPNNAGNLLVADWSGNTLCEYTEAGSPTGSCVATTGEWLDIAVSRNSKVVLGISETNENGSSLLFPSGTHRHTYDNFFFEPNGVAFDPGQKGI